MKCSICPRACGVDRSKTKGYCLQTEKVRVSKVMFHTFEEPCISGINQKGSGAIFFAGCNLKCVFCQNYLISHLNKGKNISVLHLAHIFKKLEKRGALNINLVTPTHYTMQIIEALKIYKPSIPVVWNSSGYECAETIKLLDGLVDVFLVDMKYADNNLAKKYSRAENYVENCRASIKEMKRQQPKDVFEGGLLKKGVIIRHLVLPNNTQDSVNCLKYIAQNYGKDTIVSIMSQYEPCYEADKFAEINRKLKPLEYKRVVSCAQELDMMNCYTQELSSANNKCYTPKF